MFDLKKRNSLTLRDSRGTEEFRRVAVRRKVQGPVGDCQTSGEILSALEENYFSPRALMSIFFNKHVGLMMLLASRLHQLWVLIKNK